jgi:pimeloyl-ACP methyl ester carboxylesterase
VLPVHGITSDHSTFDELVPYLAERRRVYRWDRRGRGLSGDGPSDGYGPELAHRTAPAALIARCLRSFDEVREHAGGRPAASADPPAPPASTQPVPE